MSDDEKRMALLHEIVAWGEAADEHEEGSPEYREFQNKMVKARWELKALGPPDSPGVVISVVDPE